MFSSKSNAEAHAKTVHENVRFPCLDAKCEQVFTTKRSATEHFKRVHESEDPEHRRFPCPLQEDENCLERFYTAGEADRHARSAHNKDRIPCIYAEECECEETFCSTQAAKRHALAVHDGERYPCPLCESVFTDKSYIEGHIKRVHNKNPEDKRILCPHAKEFDCDERFWSTEEAKRHSRQAHNKDRVPCLYAKEANCDRTFDSVGRATTHARSQHLGVRYPCLIPGCDETYAKEAYLKEHMERAHPTKDSWPCEFAEELDCLETFPTKPKANYHAREQQSDKYICQHSDCLVHVQEKKMTAYWMGIHQGIPVKRGHFKKGECPPLRVSDIPRGA